MTDRWEYVLHFFDATFRRSEYIEFLNKLGSEGWEMCAGTEWRDDNTCPSRMVFKRRVGGRS